MKETKYYCDMCKKEIINIRYQIHSDSLQGLLLQPDSVEVCSKECIKEWLRRDKK